MNDKLKAYRKRRDFTKTAEPAGKKKTKGKSLIFVVQKHDASRLHYDFRLQIGNTLKSWAVPKGPSLQPKNKRLAVLTEDHPLEYANFEGTIPEEEYGGGSVMLWDKGCYQNLKKDKNGKEISMKRCFEDGRIEIYLKGKKLRGGFALVRFRNKNWLLIKMKDEEAKSTGDILKSEPYSVKSSKSMKEIAKKQKNEVEKLS